jgi:type VI secretion system protein ImpE
VSSQSVNTLLRDGNLAEAIQTVQARLRKSPTDLTARVLLAELLVISGQFERADIILDAATTIDPSASLIVAEFRQLLRAASARQQLFMDGRVPEFLSEPTPVQRLQLQAIVGLRSGDIREVVRLSEQAEAARPRVIGLHANFPFDDFRDADDILSGSLEVLTVTGKYFWIPTERVITAAFHPPVRPRDLVWRRVSMKVTDGPDGDVYIPSIYPLNLPGQEDAITDPLRLGLHTDWRELDTRTALGIGQRTFLVGDTGVEIMALTELRFSV